MKSELIKQLKTMIEETEIELVNLKAFSLPELQSKEQELINYTMLLEAAECL